MQSVGTSPGRLFFQDEARFGRITDARRCWAPAGVRPDVPAQLVREYTYVYAAVSPLDGAVVSLILPEVHAETMGLFLREVADRHPGEQILMFLDGAGWHTAQRLVVPDGSAWLCHNCTMEVPGSITNTPQPDRGSGHFEMISRWCQALSQMDYIRCGFGCL